MVRIEGEFGTTTEEGVVEVFSAKELVETIVIGTKRTQMLRKKCGIPYKLYGRREVFIF